MARIQYKVIVRQPDGMERVIMVKCDVGFSDPPFTKERAIEVVKLGQGSKKIMRDPNDPTQPLRDSKGRIMTGDGFFAEGEIVSCERVDPTESPKGLQDFKDQLAKSESDDTHKRTSAKSGAKPTSGSGT